MVGGIDDDVGYLHRRRSSGLLHTSMKTNNPELIRLQGNAYRIEHIVSNVLWIIQGFDIRIDCSCFGVVFESIIRELRA